MVTKIKALNTGCSDEILKTVFLDLLSSQCRAVLTVFNIKHLNTLATTADKYIEASGHPHAPVMKVSIQPSAIEALHEQVSNMTAEDKKLFFAQNLCGCSRSQKPGPAITPTV